MASGITVKKCNVDVPGANAFRNSAAVKADIERRCKAVASTAEKMCSADISGTSKNPAYAVHVRDGKTRASGIVIAANPKSIIDNTKNNTLLKSLYAGG